MSRKVILLAVTVLIFMACVVQAQEQTSTDQKSGLFQPQPGHDGKLHATFAGTYLSKFIWRGFDLYQGHGAIQPSVDVDLFGTGFGVTTYYSTPLTGGNTDQAWMPSTVYYHNGLFKDEIYAMNYTFGYTYFNWPGSSWHLRDFHEVFGSFCFPKILPFGLVPTYTMAYDMPAGNNNLLVNGYGWAHIFGLGYDWALPAMLPDTTEQVFHFSFETIYNGGIGPGNPQRPGSRVDHDWSHGVFGVQTDVPLAKNLFFVPGFFYQSSWDDSVNQQDEAWVSLAMKYSF